MLLALLFGIFVFMAGCAALNSNSKSGEQPAPSFSFIYMSDTQPDPENNNYSSWGELLKKAAGKNRPAFIMIGGDLINDGNDQEEWNRFFAAGGEVLKNMKLYPAVGNHENPELFRRLFELPSNGPINRQETFYSFDYGNAHFTVLDSNAMGGAEQEDLAWLQKDLSSTKQPNKIVMFHHPPYPAIAIPKDMDRAQAIQQAFVPILEANEVDLVLSGHQHVYMRTFPLRHGKRDEHGIVYLIGNSGGKHYPPGSFDYVASIHQGSPVYTIVSVEAEGIVIETWDAAGNLVDSTRGPILSAEQSGQLISISGDGIAGKRELRLGELAQLPNSGFEHVYSTVNTWPTPKFYAAKGLTVRSLLQAAGVLDGAQVVTFRSPDGYQISLTREQLLEQPRFYFPQAAQGKDDGAEPVEPIIAYAFKEGSTDLEAVRTEAPCLIFGQSHPREQSNPAFVEKISEIIISNQPAAAWESAGTFPTAGRIAAGETVKLQHRQLGTVKIHYTLDGSEPTELSPIYNISTYQPQLNVPIAIPRDTVIKTLVVGFGKKNSSVSEFRFDVQ